MPQQHQTQTDQESKEETETSEGGKKLSVQTRSLEEGKKMVSLMNEVARGVHAGHINAFADPEARKVVVSGPLPDAPHRTIPGVDIEIIIIIKPQG